ncbi:DNA-3-methyladenine glycosylase [Bacillus sp. MMSF_3328]|uniref:DNA-3-methyladenine glycosylase family protein n=1 Tax=Bacillus sp. MMSF_3328 TaxID=3047080 RepID=UPI00273D2F96|nr:DNA-3-methyladenine glycosylase 2 family protein [Bacillus sp. MMSF_3328]
MSICDNKLPIFQSDLRVIEICNSDIQLSKLIRIIGDIEIELRQDYFKALTKSIIGQQLSPKAAGTIYSRFEQLLQNKITPSSMNEFNDEQLRSVGVSKQKISYLRDLSNRFLSGEINLDEIDQMENEQVIKTLTSVKGIGKWTAEMFLIFSLGRMDVLPLNDVGLQRAVKWLYSQEEETDIKSCFLEKAKAWGKNTTIACLYLWESVNQDLIKVENIDKI